MLWQYLNILLFRFKWSTSFHGQVSKITTLQMSIEKNLLKIKFENYPKNRKKLPKIRNTYFGHFDFNGLKRYFDNNNYFTNEKNRKRVENCCSFHSIQSHRITEFWNKQKPKHHYFELGLLWLFDPKPGNGIKMKHFWYAIKAKSLQTMEESEFDMAKRVLNFINGSRIDTQNIREMYPHFIIKIFQSMPRNIIVKVLVLALITSQAHTNTQTEYMMRPSLINLLHDITTFLLQWARRSETRSGTRYDQNRHFHLPWLL